MRRLPHVVRRALAKLTVWLRATLGCAALVAALAAGRTPSPAAVVHTPTTAVHTEFVVETNRLGQVTRVRSGVSSKDAAFNAMTYGNALQSFIRTDSGRAVAGTYRLDYDYDPRRKAVKRSVAIVRAGGVNPNAPGAVTVEERKLAKQSHTGAGAAASPGPLPDLKAITSPSH